MLKIFSFFGFSLLVLQNSLQKIYHRNQYLQHYLWYKFLNQNISINKIKYNKSKQLHMKLLIRLNSITA